MRFGVILGPCVAVCAVIAPELAYAQPTETAQTAPSAKPARSNAGVQLQFRGLTLLDAEPSSDGREVSLRLKEPIDPNFVKAMTGQEPEWLESVSAGYDTLLIRATRPVRFETARTEGG